MYNFAAVKDYRIIIYMRIYMYAFKTLDPEKISRISTEMRAIKE